MEIRYYLRMLRRGWWLIILTALVALNVALVTSYMATPMYRASARFVVSPNASLTSSNLVNSIDTLDKRSIISTYAEVLNSTRIYSQTIDDLGIPASKSEAYSHKVVVLPEANVLELSIEGPDPQIAMQLVNNLGQRAIEYAMGLNQIYDISFLDPATTPTEPYSPQPIRDAGIAFVLGLIIGAGLAIIREQLQMPLDVLRQRNMYDSLSSAYSRRYFQRMLEQEMARSSIAPLSLGLVKLDGLTDLIDTLPQPIVQRILHEAASILRKELRGNDSVGKWNDVTFSIMLPSTPGSAAARTLDRIRQALAMPLRIDLMDFDLEPIIGISVRRGAETVNQLIEGAEQSLDRSRKSGGQVSPFSADALTELGYWEDGVDALAPNMAGKGVQEPLENKDRI